jgi:hypothetical protein
MEAYEKNQSYIWLLGDDKVLLKISLFCHYKVMPVLRYMIILERYNFLVCIHVFLS